MGRYEHGCVVRGNARLGARRPCLHPVAVIDVIDVVDVVDIVEKAGSARLRR
jgi:hypothetical protein